jgi:tetratricopeptide (TPR) repeat protein
MRFNIFTSLFILFYINTAIAQNNVAFKLYSNKNYKEALVEYKKIETLQTNDNLCYNIGNCYFKLNDVGNAVAYYEKALKLNPNNTDAQSNLQFCNKRLIDKVTTVEPFIVSRWGSAITSMYSGTTWAMVILLCTLLIAALLYRFFVVERTATTLVALGVCGMLLIVSVLSANANYNRLNENTIAIVTQPTLHVKSAPMEQSNELFTLHEGCKITILQKVDTWLNIQVNSGNIGWIKSTDVVII